MSSKRIKVGIVGCGHMGSLHTKTVLKHPLCELAAIYEPNKKKNKRIERGFGVKVFNTLNEFLKQPMDLAIIASITGTHTKNAIPIMRKGIHVLTEKPIDDTVGNAIKMIKEAEKCNVKLMVSHTEFFNPGVKKIKRMLNDKIIGKVYGFNVWRFRPIPESERIVGSGIILDCLVHDVYNLRYWFGQDVISVYGIQKKVSYKTPPFNDWCCGVINFNSISGTFQASWTYPIYKRETEIFGKKGIIKLDYINNILTVQKNYKKKIINVEQRGKDNLTRLLDAVVANIRNKKDFPISTYDSLYSLQVCKAMEKSSKIGKIVYLKEILSKHYKLSQFLPS